MAKQNLQERFQELAGIKSLNEKMDMEGMHGEGMHGEGMHTEKQLASGITNK